MVQAVCKNYQTFSEKKVVNMHEMKIVCLLLSFIQKEIQENERMLAITNLQYATQLFKNADLQKLNTYLIEYQSKLKILRSIANTVTKLLAEKGEFING